MKMQENCKIYLKQIWMKCRKSYLNQKSKKVYSKILNCFEVQQAAIKLYNGCASIASEVKYKIKYGEALKIP